MTADPRVWLWHHGPIDAPEDACVGWLDPPLLDPAAEAESARRLAERIGSAPTVYASDLRRARQAARPLARALGARLEITPALREINYGAWEGQSWSTIRHRDGAQFDRYMADWETTAMPGGESHAELHARVSAWFEGIEQEGAVVVAHAGSLRVIATVLMGWTADEALRVALARGHYAAIDPTEAHPPEWNRHPRSGDPPGSG